MSRNKTNPYAIEAHLAEIYDQIETDLEDVALLRRLIGTIHPLRILEPFCGTGRILIPLALDGHEIVGMDQARNMLDRTRQKIGLLPPVVQQKITLVNADVITAKWPQGFDLVILGGNCFYELATPQEQEKCIRSAERSLVAGGMIYIDNDHMEGELDKAWQIPGASQLSMVGVCSDGTSVEGSRETIWYDVPRRLVKFRRWTKVILADGRSYEKEFIQQKHPISVIEIHSWLEAHGFVLVEFYGDHAGNPYVSTSQRAIFWARKSEELKST
jgi:SAM-dependent methyltransferase